MCFRRKKGSTLLRPRKSTKNQKAGIWWKFMSIPQVLYLTFRKNWGNKPESLDIIAQFLYEKNTYIIDYHNINHYSPRYSMSYSTNIRVHIHSSYNHYRTVSIILATVYMYQVSKPCIVSDTIQTLQYRYTVQICHTKQETLIVIFW